MTAAKLPEKIEERKKVYPARRSSRISSLTEAKKIRIKPAEDLEEERPLLAIKQEEPSTSKEDPFLPQPIDLEDEDVRIVESPVVQRKPKEVRVRQLPKVTQIVSQNEKGTGESGRLCYKFVRGVMRKPIFIHKTFDLRVPSHMIPKAPSEAEKVQKPSEIPAMPQEGIPDDQLAYTIKSKFADQFSDRLLGDTFPSNSSSDWPEEAEVAASLENGNVAEIKMETEETCSKESNAEDSPRKAKRKRRRKSKECKTVENESAALLVADKTEKDQELIVAEEAEDIRKSKDDEHGEKRKKRRRSGLHKRRRSKEINSDKDKEENDLPPEEIAKDAVNLGNSGEESEDEANLANRILKLSKGKGPNRRGSSSHRDEEEDETEFTEVTDLHNTELFTNKRYCHFCKMNCLNFYVHVQEVHFDEREVKKFFKATRGSTCRRMILKKWYLHELYCTSLEQNHRLICSHCLQAVPTSNVIPHYVLSVAKKAHPSFPFLSHERIFGDLRDFTITLKRKFSSDTWMDLAKSLLASLYLLNERTMTVEHLTLGDYARRVPFSEDKHQELAEIAKEWEEITNLANRGVPLKIIPQQRYVGFPLFVTREQEEAADLLFEYRIEAEIPLDNPYLFGCVLRKNKIRLLLGEAIQFYTPSNSRHISEKRSSFNSDFFKPIFSDSENEEAVPPEKAKEEEEGEELHTTKRMHSGGKPQQMSLPVGIPLRNLIVSIPKLGIPLKDISQDQTFSVSMVDSVEEKEVVQSHPSPVEEKQVEEKKDETPLCVYPYFISKKRRKSGEKARRRKKKKKYRVQSITIVKPSETPAIDLSEEPARNSSRSSSGSSTELSPSNRKRSKSNSSSEESNESIPEVKRRKSVTFAPRLSPLLLKRAKEEKKTDDIINDVYKCFKTTKKGKNGDGQKMIDVRDLISCRCCKKYFLRNCFFKHRKFCRKIPKRRSSTRDDAKEEIQSKHRGVSTLQSPSGFKKYFCIFCKETFTRLSKHLEHMHKDQEEVQEMLKHPKGSVEREKILYKLRTRGTFTFNANAEYNRGRIIVSRRPNPSLQRTNRDFLPCPYCRNYFAKKTLYRHSKRCSNKEGLQKDLRRKSLALIGSSHPRCDKIMATQIIPRLVDDDISRTIKRDELLILFGNHLTRKYPAIKRKGYYIRRSLRIASKFFMTVKSRRASIANFSSMYNPEHCGVVIGSLLEVAGYQREVVKFPEIARKLDRIINVCGEILSMEYSKGKRVQEGELVAKFLKRFSESYREEIVTKLTREKPSSDFERKLFQFAQGMMLEKAQRLKRNFSLEDWIQLGKYLLVYLRFLNNNLQDGACLFVSDYLQRHSLDADEDSATYHGFGPLPQFPTNYLKVKLRNVPMCVVLSQEFCGAVDVLLENREDAGVLPENFYLFGKPGEKYSFFTTKEALNYVKMSMNEIPKSEPVNDANSYLGNIKKAFDHHTTRMLDLTGQLRENFSNQTWIELVKCTLTCVQLTNDKTYAEVVQYLLLIDYDDKETLESPDVSEFSSLIQNSEGFCKLRMHETPITLILGPKTCDALDLLIQERPRANIDEENPYVFACSGNKYNYYRSEGCIGSLPVSDGVEEILSLRRKIINDLIKKGSAGIQLWSLLPETEEDLVKNTTRVFYYAQTRMVVLKYKLEEKFSSEIWLELIRCLLAYVHLLNDNSPEEPERLLIADYYRREKLDFGEKRSAYHSLDDSNDFPQNYLKVNVGPARFVLVSLDFCETVDLLLKHRQECGVHADNPYVFGCRGNKENFLRAHGVLGQVAGRCNVKRLKYFKAKRGVSGEVRLQECRLEVKHVPKIERDLVLHKAKVEQIIKSSENPTAKTGERVQRRRWTPVEMEVASRNFVTCLTKGYLPSVFQCQQVIAANVELHHRTAEQLKAWVYNQIQKGDRRSRTSAAGRAGAPPPDPSPMARPTRCRWTSVERELVRFCFAENMAAHTLPSAADCRRVILAHEPLGHRTPEQMRAWINNQNKKSIAAKKSAVAAEISQ